MSVSESQLASWKEEQLQIASQVVSLDNSPETTPGVDDKSKQYRRVPPVLNENTLLGGVDVSFPENEEDEAIATYIISKGNKEVVYRSHKRFSLTVPYVSSFLAFREIGPLVELVTLQIKDKPELTPSIILVDGNGTFHERRAGIACFLGVKTGIATIGVGKTLYCMDGLTHSLVEKGITRVISDIYGTYKRDVEFFQATGDKQSLIFSQNPINTSIPYLDNSRKDTCVHGVPSVKEMLSALSPLCNGLAIYLQGKSGSTLACALVGHGGKVGSKSALSHRCGTKNPIFVSVGHKISLEDAVQVCSEVSLARIPEPVREADLYGRRLIQEHRK